MPKTKTNYREYIDSAVWQERRKQFLSENNICTRCSMPRWLAEIVYDQDLNVHHKSYANLGHEDWGDLEPLCRRCHEIDKFGRSELREPKNAICGFCGITHFNYYSELCPICDTIFGTYYLSNLSRHGKPIARFMLALLASHSILSGKSKDQFLIDVRDMYAAGEEAAPQMDFLLGK